ncbi:MAG: rhodanese-like domain-containing protein [Saprospiraceae bacterium]|nr:rhodanese-like domain-containing protein [Saprospiraceae bacterium]
MPNFSLLKIAIAIALMLLTWVSYGQVQRGAYRTMLKTLLSHSVPEIGIQQAAKDSTSVVFLDAREPREFEVSHIAGAIPVGYDHFDINQLPALDKVRPVVVYCSVGFRSEKIAEKLLAAGFQNVSNLYGGIFEWVNQGHHVVNEGGPTQEVHAYSKSWGIWLRKGKKVFR